MKKILCVIAAVAALTIPAIASDIPSLPIEDIREVVLTGNIDIQQAEQGLTQAQRVKETTTIESTRLALSGGYTYEIEDTGPDSQPALSGSASLTIPIVPQLQISGQINSNGDGSATVSLNPFADPEVTYRETETLKKAEISFAYTERGIISQLESAFLDMLISAKNAGLAESSLAIAEQDLLFTEEAYRLDAATYDDLFDSEQAVVDARKSYFTALKNESSAGSTLSQLMGIAGTGLELPNVDLDALLSLTTSRRGFLYSFDNSAPLTQYLENLDAEYRSLQGEFADTPFFQPDVSMSLAVDYPLSKATGSVSVNISPSQINANERQDILRSIEIKEAEMAEAQYGLQVDIQIAEKVVAIAEEALASSLADLERRETTYKETAYLGTLGERTDLEVAQAKLSFELAQLSAYSSAADLYSSQNDLAAFFI